MPDGNKSLKNRLIIVLSLMVVVLSIIILVLLLARSNKEVDSFLYEPNATIGLLLGVDREALLAQMQQYTDQSAIAFVINVRPTLKGGKMDILFENPAGNHKDLTVELVDDETEEIVYKSGALAEGCYIETIKLDKKYSPGVYMLTAYIVGYELETHNEIGQTAAEIKMTVR